MTAELAHFAEDTSIVSVSEQLAVWRLIRSDRIGPKTFNQLVTLHGDSASALEAVPQMAARAGGKELTVMPEAQARQELERLENLGGTLITYRDPRYPRALKAIADAPPALTVRGDPRMLEQTCIALVGARNASLNGRKFTSSLAKALVEAEYTIVSGLARGIDTAAHEGAGPGNTVAVLAGGVDYIYPRENTALYERIIAEGGAIVSERAPGAVPKAEDFPRRNRIISGSSKASIVIEAALRSGSLITARFAAEQGREVMAVPGSPLDPRAAGPNKLIQDGAALVTSAEDVLKQLDFLHQQVLEPRLCEPEDAFDAGVAFAETEAPEALRDACLALLDNHGITVDALVQELNAPAAQVMVALLELELAGKIVRLPGNRVALIA